MKVQEALKKVIETEGIDVLKKGQICFNMIKDLAPSDKPGLEDLKWAFERKIPTMLVDSNNMSDTEKRQVIEQIYNGLIGTFNSKTAKRICEILLYAVQWNVSIPQYNEENDNVSDTSNTLEYYNVSQQNYSKKQISNTTDSVSTLQSPSLKATQKTVKKASRKIVLSIIAALSLGIIVPLIIHFSNRNQNTTSSQRDFANDNTKASTIVEYSTNDNTEPSTQHNRERLIDMTVSESDGYYNDKASVMDSVGNNYEDNIITLGSTGVLGNGTSYATFYLGGQYKLLAGKLAVNNSSINGYTASFSIYCDDDEVYNSGEVSKQFAPTDISVNVENCQWLKVVVNNFAANGGENINFILSDFCLYEDVDLIFCA